MCLRHHAVYHPLGPHPQSASPNHARPNHAEPTQKGSENYRLEDSINHRGSSRDTTFEVVRLGEVLCGEGYRFAERRIECYQEVDVSLEPTARPSKIMKTLYWFDDTV